MRQLFSPEGSVMLFITRLVNSVWLNILWFVFSIPIITVGASTTALFYVSLKMARNEEGNITSQFFQAFKRFLFGFSLAPSRNDLRLCYILQYRVMRKQIEILEHQSEF